MPRGDGTGPMGMGPMTGRGAGYCAGGIGPGYAGYGRGGGFGRGFRRMFYTTGQPGWTRFGNPYFADPSAAAYDDKEILKRQADVLQNQLEQINKRLSNIEKDTE